MAIITPTIYGRGLTTAKKFGVNYTPLPNTNLVELIQNPQVVASQPTVTTAGSEIIDPYDPDIDSQSMYTKYLVLGNNGHEIITGANLSTAIASPVEHATTRTAPYHLIPLLVRSFDDDLTPSQRLGYRLRKVLEIDGDYWIAYFAKVITPSSSVIDYSIYELQDQQVVGATPFVPTLQEATGGHPTGDIANDRTDVASTLPLLLGFDNAQINEIINACEIVFGDARAAFVSEAALCFGVDKTVLQSFPFLGAQTPTNAPANTYYEATLMTVDTFISDILPVSNTTTQISFNLSAGGSTPLYPTSRSGLTR